MIWTRKILKQRRRREGIFALHTYSWTAYGAVNQTGIMNFSRYLSAKIILTLWKEWTRIFLKVRIYVVIYIFVICVGLCFHLFNIFWFYKALPCVFYMYMLSIQMKTQLICSYIDWKEVRCKFLCMICVNNG